MTVTRPHQPYSYRRFEAVEPEWRRFPGWRDVSEAQWRDVRWQRKNSIKTIRDLRDVLGGLVDDAFYEDVKRDQARHATMSMLVTPQVLNTMVPDDVPTTDGLYEDPVRRYMVPAASDRHPRWPTHPRATRDPLREAEMWTVEGLTHRYPTKVLAELLTTCPVYCGHCTRMDLVGPSTAQVSRRHFTTKSPDRREQMLDYLRVTPSVRDVVVSGGDLTNLPWPRLEEFLADLMDIESIRDIRLASKGLMSLPQHWLSDEIRRGVERMATKAFDRGITLAIHTHVNAASQVTGLFAEAARAMAEAGIHHIRNQGVLLRRGEFDPRGAAGSLLRVARHSRRHSVLLLPLRHDPGVRALAAVGGRGADAPARHHGLPARVRHPATPLRRALRRQAMGRSDGGVRPRAWDLLLDQELPHLRRCR